ncbi:MAG: hypothetical protein K9K88_03780 [Desulfobacterales bacterium]|nr:hypothetical protein [Desulfobacterales bacterium]
MAGEETYDMEGRFIVVTISDQDLMRMKAALLDDDRDEALQIIKELVKQLEIQAGRRGLL